MPIIPAFCDTCGTAFPSGFFFENASNVTLSGNRSGPCPSCGGMGHVPDGVFNFIGNTIEILSAPQRTVKELTRLVRIIHEAKEKQQSNEQVAAQIKQELPGLSSLADILPKNRGGALWLSRRGARRYHVTYSVSSGISKHYNQRISGCRTNTCKRIGF